MGTDFSFPSTNSWMSVSSRCKWNILNGTSVPRGFLFQQKTSMLPNPNMGPKLPFINCGLAPFKSTKSSFLNNKTHLDTWNNANCFLRQQKNRSEFVMFLVPKSAKVNFEPFAGQTAWVPWVWCGLLVVKWKDISTYLPLWARAERTTKQNINICEWQEKNMHSRTHVILTRSISKLCTIFIRRKILNPARRICRHGFTVFGKRRWRLKLSLLLRFKCPLFCITKLIRFNEKDEPRPLERKNCFLTSGNNAQQERQNEVHDDLVLKEHCD